VADGIPKWARIITGIMLMTAFVMISLAIITRYAGGWGVPYFSFQTERGSSCTNNLTGYTCHPVTLPDVTFYGDVELPKDTRVVSATYHSTHDYQLNASLLVPRASAPAALAGLHESFGGCQPEHLAPMSTRGLTAVCVMANDDAVTNDAETSSRLFTVGTGLRSDGSRTIVLSVKSR
jgi:hypothetical protein